MLNKVLLPIALPHDILDLIAASEYIADFCLEELILLHVVTTDLNRHQLEKKLKHMVQTLNELKEYKTSYEIREGHLATEIISLAREKSVDLITVPTRQKNLLFRALFGSTSGDILRLTDMATLILKKYHDKHLDTILFGTDFDEAAERVLPYVSFLGQKARRVVAVNVGKRASDPLAERKRQALVQEKLDALQEVLSADFEEVILIQEIGRPSTSIIQQAKKTRADLIIMGRFNRWLKNKVLGSTAERVSQTAPVSVLLVP